MLRTSILSVFDKTNISRFADFLATKNVNILSTGGTFNLLKSNPNLQKKNLLKEVSDVTKFPEILGGRVKTLHPYIHGGILAKREDTAHIQELTNHNIKPIDLVVVNLYPFEEVVANPKSTHDDVLENIDIGGHTLIRASAKNYKDVIIATNSKDYDLIMDKWDVLSSTNPKDDENMMIRKDLASKAWDHIVKYDMAISQYFRPDNKIIYKRYEKEHDLKYGLNPQQGEAGIYKNTVQASEANEAFTILHGNIGYINVLDAIYGWNLVSELSKELNCPAAASYKHNSPAGVAISSPNLFSLTPTMKKMFLMKGDETLSPVAEAFVKARNVDPMCSFGDFISICGTVDVQTANFIASEVSDGIIASDYEPEALEILKRKKNGSYVVLKGHSSNRKNTPQLEIREMRNITLIQESNEKRTRFSDLKFDNEYFPSEIEQGKAKINLIIANTTLKYSQSNSVASAGGGQTLGVGAGQQSRIDCVNLVKRKTEHYILRQHPKCISLTESFQKGVKKTDKINIITDYIKGTLDVNAEHTKSKLTCIPEPLTNEEKKQFLTSFYSNTNSGEDGNYDISLASDAFFPFRDNIDIAATFGVKYIAQPGGSTQDGTIKKACEEHNISMAMTGRNMRMFLH